MREGEEKGKVRTVRREEGVERGAQDQVRCVRATDAGENSQHVFPYSQPEHWRRTGRVADVEGEDKLLRLAPVPYPVRPGIARAAHAVCETTGCSRRSGLRSFSRNFRRLEVESGER